AAARELAEETGIDVDRAHLEQLGTFSAPLRDPRMRVISVAHLAFVPDLGDPTAGSDATDAVLWPLVDVVDENLDLAFDHGHILAAGVRRARAKLSYTTLATRFCPPQFTIGQLLRVYEAVWDTTLLRSNFTRKVLSADGFVVDT